MIESQKEFTYGTGFLSNTTALILLAVVLVLTIYHFIFQSLNWVKMGNKIPGPPYLPIVGNAFEVMVAPKAHQLGRYAIDRLEAEFPNEGVVRVWLGPKLIVALRDPRDVELVLGGHKHMQKTDEYNFFEPWLGQGLLISKGERWSSHRKMLVPTFHQSILKSYIPVFNENAQRLINDLKKHVGGKPFDIHDYMSAITVDILLETTMGVKRSQNKNAGFDYAMAVIEMCDILYQRIVKFWLRPNSLFNLSSLSKKQEKLLSTIHNLADDTIRRKKQDFFERRAKGLVTNIYQNATNDYKIDEKNNQNPSPAYNNYNGLKDDLDDEDLNDVGEKKRLAFLDYMIEASQIKGNHFSDTEIREEVNTFMFEGHDTTTAACSFVMVILGLYPDVQEKVVEELKEIFDGKLNPNEPITLTHIMKMKYLERVLLETMRLYPPVPGIARTAEEDIKLVSGDYTIPKGTTVIIAQYLIHRYHKVYDDPHTFNPDNFLPENCVKRHYYSYIPFSAGPRSCVGRKYAMLKVKVLLASMIRAFKVKSFVPEEDFELQPDIILKRHDGFEIQLENRCL